MPVVTKKKKKKVSKSAGSEKPSLLALFKKYDDADTAIQEAKAIVEEKTEARSKVVSSILKHYGKGPFDFKGANLIVSSRKTKDETDEEGNVTEGKKNYFFKKMGGSVTKVE